MNIGRRRNVTLISNPFLNLSNKTELFFFIFNCVSGRHFQDS